MRAGRERIARAARTVRHTRALAHRRAAWQAARMRRSSPVAGGFPIAVGALLGTVAGLVLRQPSIGFLAGLALGCVVALVVWLRDR